MLIAYNESTPKSKGRPIINIPCTYIKHVDHVKERHRKIIVIEVLYSDHRFSFYAESAETTAKWFKYCGLLFSIPCYVIPKIPEENLVSQCFIDEYNDPTKFDASK